MARVGGRPRGARGTIGARTKVVCASVVSVLAALSVPIAVVFACVSVAALTATPQTVQPGGTVTVTGGDYVPGFPVQIHLDSVDGPVVGTVASPTGPSSMRSQFRVDVTLPSTLSVGQHVLIATQNSHNMTAGMPARAAIYVGAAPQPGQQNHRTAYPVVENGPGLGALALIAAAAAVFGLIVLLVATLLTSRRPRRTGAAGA